MVKPMKSVSLSKLYLVFHTDQMDELNGEAVEITPLPFMSLIVTLILKIPPEMWYYFEFIIFLGGSSSSVFHWTLSHHNNPCPQVGGLK